MDKLSRLHPHYTKLVPFHYTRLIAWVMIFSLTLSGVIVPDLIQPTYTVYADEENELPPPDENDGNLPPDENDGDDGNPENEPPPSEPSFSITLEEVDPAHIIQGRPPLREGEIPSEVKEVLLTVTSDNSEEPTLPLNLVLEGEMSIFSILDEEGQPLPSTSLINAPTNTTSTFLIQLTSLPFTTYGVLAVDIDSDVDPYQASAYIELGFLPETFPTLTPNRSSLQVHRTYLGIPSLGIYTTLSTQISGGSFNRYQWQPVYTLTGANPSHILVDESMLWFNASTFVLGFTSDLAGLSYNLNLSLTCPVYGVTTPAISIPLETIGGVSDYLILEALNTFDLTPISGVNFLVNGDLYYMEDSSLVVRIPMNETPDIAVQGSIEGLTLDSILYEATDNPHIFRGTAQFIREQVNMMFHFPPEFSSQTFTLNIEGEPPITISDGQSISVPKNLDFTFGPFSEDGSAITPLISGVTQTTEDYLIMYPTPSNWNEEFEWIEVGLHYFNAEDAGFIETNIEPVKFFLNYDSHQVELAKRSLQIPSTAWTLTSNFEDYGATLELEADNVFIFRIPPFFYNDNILVEYSEGNPVRNSTLTFATNLASLDEPSPETFLLHTDDNGFIVEFASGFFPLPRGLTFISDGSGHTFEPINLDEVYTSLKYDWRVLTLERELSTVHINFVDWESPEYIHRTEEHSLFLRSTDTLLTILNLTSDPADWEQDLEDSLYYLPLSQLPPEILTNLPTEPSLPLPSTLTFNIPVKVSRYLEVTSSTPAEFEFEGVTFQTPYTITTQHNIASPTPLSVEGYDLMTQVDSIPLNIEAYSTTTLHLEYIPQSEVTLHLQDTYTEQNLSVTFRVDGVDRTYLLESGTPTRLPRGQYVVTIATPLDPSYGNTFGHYLTVETPDGSPVEITYYLTPKAIISPEFSYSIDYSDFTDEISEASLFSAFSIYTEQGELINPTEDPAYGNYRLRINSDANVRERGNSYDFTHDGSPLSISLTLPTTLNITAISTEDDEPLVYLDIELDSTPPRSSQTNTQGQVTFYDELDPLFTGAISINDPFLRINTDLSDTSIDFTRTNNIDRTIYVDPVEINRILVKDYHTSTPIENVEVILSSGETFTTNYSGQAYLLNIPAGDYTLGVNQLSLPNPNWYEDFSDFSITVTEDELKDILITLRRREGSVIIPTQGTLGEPEVIFSLLDKTSGDVHTLHASGVIQLEELPFGDYSITPVSVLPEEGFLQNPEPVDFTLESETLTLPTFEFEAKGNLTLRFHSILTASEVTPATFNLGSSTHTSGSNITILTSDTEISNINLPNGWEVFDTDLSVNLTEPGEHIDRSIGVIRRISPTLSFRDRRTNAPLANVTITFDGSMYTSFSNGNIVFSGILPVGDITVISTDGRNRVPSEPIQWEPRDSDFIQVVYLDREASEMIISVTENFTQEPVAGVSIYIPSLDTTYTSDAQGRIAVPEAEFDLYTFEIEPPENYRINNSLQYFEYDGAPISLSVIAQATLQVTASELYTGAPVYNVRLALRNPGSPISIWSSTTNEDGYLLLGPIDAGDYDLAILSTNSGHTYEGPSTIPVSLTQAGTQDTPVNLDLRALRSFSVRVIDDLVPNSTTRDLGLRFIRSNGMEFTRNTSSTGNLNLTNIPDDDSYTLEVINYNTNLYLPPSTQTFSSVGLSLTDSVEIHLQRRTGTLHLRAEDMYDDSIGVPNLSFNLNFRPESSSVTQTLGPFALDNQGNFTLPNAHFGIYSFEFINIPEEFRPEDINNTLRINNANQEGTLTATFEILSTTVIVAWDSLMNTPVSGLNLEVQITTGNWRALPTTDAQGQTVVMGLQNNRTYQVRPVSDTPYFLQTSNLRTFRHNTDIESHTISLDRRRHSITIYAKLENEDVMVNDLTLQLQLGENHTFGPATTAGQGRVQFNNIPVGAYTVRETAYPVLIAPNPSGYSFSSFQDQGEFTINYSRNVGITLTIFDALYGNRISNLDFLAYRVPDNTPLDFSLNPRPERPDFTNPSRLVTSIRSNASGVIFNQLITEMKVAVYPDFRDSDPYEWQLGYNIFDTLEGAGVGRIDLHRKTTTVIIEAVSGDRKLSGVRYTIRPRNPINTHIEPGNNIPAAELERLSHIFTGTTNSEGQVIFENVPWNDYTLTDEVFGNIVPSNMERLLRVNHTTNENNVAYRHSYQERINISIQPRDSVTGDLRTGLDVTLALVENRTELMTRTSTQEHPYFFANLLPGRYTYTIRNIPDMYIPATETDRANYELTGFFDAAGGTVTRTINLERNRMQFSVTVTDNTGARTPIQGVRFSLTPQTGSPLYANSNNNGVATFNNVPQGTYILEMMQAPAAFTRDTTTHTIVLDQVRNPSNSGLNPVYRLPRLATIELRAFDQISGEMLQGRFEWTRPNGTVSRHVQPYRQTLVLTQVPQGNNVIRAYDLPSTYNPTPVRAAEASAFTDSPHTEYRRTLNAQGSAMVVDMYYQRRHTDLVLEFKDTKYNLPIQGVEYRIFAEEDGLQRFVNALPNRTLTSNAQGVIRFPNLPVGRYRVEEVSVPDNIQREGFTLTINLSAGDAPTELRYNLLMPLLIQIRNAEAYTSLIDGGEFRVTNLTTGEVAFDSNATPPVRRSLGYTQEAQYMSITVPTFDTVTRRLIIPGLEQRAYSVQATSTNIGTLYRITGEAQTIEIVNAPTQLTLMANRPSARVSLEVIGETGIGVGPSTYALYRVTSEESIGSDVANIESPLAYTKILHSVLVTNAMGQAESADLESGTYIVEEIESPPGYAMTGYSSVFSVTNAATNVELTHNIQYARGHLNVRLAPSSSSYSINRQLAFRLTGRRTGNVINITSSNFELKRSNVIEDIYDVVLTTANSGYYISTSAIIGTQRSSGATPQTLTVRQLTTANVGALGVNLASPPSLTVKEEQKINEGVGSFFGNLPTAVGAFLRNVPTALGSFLGNLPTALGAFLGNLPTAVGSFFTPVVVHANPLTQKVVHFKLFDVEDKYFLQFSLNNNRDGTITVIVDRRPRSGFSPNLNASRIDEETLFVGVPKGSYILEVFETVRGRETLISSQPIEVSSAQILFPLDTEEVREIGFLVDSSFTSTNSTGGEVDPSLASVGDTINWDIILSNNQDFSIKITEITLNIPEGFELVNKTPWQPTSPNQDTTPNQDTSTDTIPSHEPNQGTSSTPSSNEISLNLDRVQEEGLVISKDGASSLRVPIRKIEDSTTTSIPPTQVPSISNVNPTNIPTIVSVNASSLTEEIETSPSKRIEASFLPTERNSNNIETRGNNIEASLPSSSTSTSATSALTEDLARQEEEPEPENSSLEIPEVVILDPITDRNLIHSIMLEEAGNPDTEPAFNLPNTNNINQPTNQTYTLPTQTISAEVTPLVPTFFVKFSDLTPSVEELSTAPPAEFLLWVITVSLILILTLMLIHSPLRKKRTRN